MPSSRLPQALAVSLAGSLVGIPFSSELMQFDFRVPLQPVTVTYRRLLLSVSVYCEEDYTYPTTSNLTPMGAGTGTRHYQMSCASSGWMNTIFRGGSLVAV